MPGTLTRPLFRLAMVQMQVVGGRKQQNLERAQTRIREAANAGAKVVLLPEALNLGWTHPSARQQADPVPLGESSQRLIESAKRCGVFVCAGLVEQSGSKVFNSALLVDPTGRVLLHHRKIHELEIGHSFYDLGDRLQVAETPFGRIGVIICADAFARGQVLSRSLALMGAEMILSPCAWAVEAHHDNQTDPYGKLWLDNYGPVARDFQIWIAGASNVGWLNEGPWAGRKCIGCSLLVGPKGQQALIGPYGPDAESILYAEIALVPRPARGEGWERWWNSNHASRGRSHSDLGQTASA